MHIFNGSQLANRGACLAPRSHPTVTTGKVRVV
jgi:hypothetical protein